MNFRRKQMNKLFKSGTIIRFKHDEIERIGVIVGVVDTGKPIAGVTYIIRCEEIYSSFYPYDHIVLSECQFVELDDVELFFQSMKKHLDDGINEAKTNFIDKYIPITTIDDKKNEVAKSAYRKKKKEYVDKIENYYKETIIELRKWENK